MVCHAMLGQRDDVVGYNGMLIHSMTVWQSATRSAMYPSYYRAMAESNSDDCSVNRKRLLTACYMSK